MSIFHGSKGSKPKSPTRTPDTLRADDTVEVVLAISEGPCEGLEDGPKSFFIGDTALQAVSGENNFSNFELIEYQGTEVGEDIVSEMGGFATNTNVSVQPAANVPIVRTTSTQNIDFLEIRFVVTQLFEQNDDGVFEDTLEFNLEYRETGTTNWLPAFENRTVSITGKTTSSYPYELRFPVPNVENTYDIRLTRTTPDSGTEHVAEFTWESYQEVSKEPFNFPGTSVLKLMTRASDQFTSIPPFSSIYKGRIVKVPSNLNQETNTYSGVWNGTFKLEWTERPAWIIYDLITNTRYGLAAYRPADLNKYDVLEADKWWSTLTADGTPRFTLNYQIKQSRRIKELATYLAGAFGGRLTEDYEGNFRLRIDDQSDAVQMFTTANISGDFSYSYTDISTRSNYINMAFINPQLDWEEDHRIIQDEDAIALHGRIPEDPIAVGCIYPVEAVRRAIYRLVSAQTETTTVTFQTAREGIYCEPHDTILVVDPEQGNGIGGRITGVSQNRRTITLRDPLNLEPGFNYVLRFTIPTSEGFDVVSYDVSDTTSGVVTEVTVTSDLHDRIGPDSVFALSNAEQTGLPRPFRITDITIDNENNDLISITAIEKNPAKWHSVDNSIIGEDVNYSSFADAFTHPARNPGFTLEVVNGQYRLNLFWERSEEKLIREYEILIAENGSEPLVIGSTRGLTFTYDNLPPGSHEIQIVAVGLKHRSIPVSVTVVAGIEESRDVPPVENLRLSGGVWKFADPVFIWDQGDPDPYFRHYRIRVVHDNEVVQTDYTNDLSYIYELSDNVANGLTRTVEVRVSKQDFIGNTSPEVVLEVTNNAPALPVSISIVGQFGQIRFSAKPNSTDVDAIGLVVHASQVSGFTPDENTLVWAGQAFNGAFELTAGEGRYVRIGVVDHIGEIDIDYTAEQLVTSSFDVTSDTTPPPVPTGGAIENEAFLRFDVVWDPYPPSVFDFDVVEVLVSTVNDPNTASVAPSPTSGTRLTVYGEPDVVHYVWLRAVDFSGNRSALTSPALEGTPQRLLGVQEAIDEAAIKADAITSSKLANDSVTLDHLTQPVVNTIDAAAQSAQADKDAAEAAATAAQQAETNAETARDVAQTARDQAQAAETDSEAARDAAQAAQSAAEQAETDAQTAQAASETARAESEAARNAAQSAQSAAETAETQAVASAGQAGVSATTAASYASDAAGSASTAQAAQAVVASTRTDVAILGRDPGMVDEEAWTLTFYTGENPTYSAPNMSGGVATLQQAWLYTRAAVPIDTSRTYRLTVRMRQLTDGSDPNKQRVYIGVTTLDENYQNITGGAGTHRYFVRSGQTILQSDGWQIYTATITGEGNNHPQFHPGTKYGRYFVGGNFQGGDGLVEVDHVIWEDVTSEVASEGHATAAATSASSAQSSETDAANSASAAQIARTAAESARDNASSSASAAASSASTAGTHATDAESSATASENSKIGAESARDASQGSASAAATSASNASSSATDASNSASASQSARVASESARDTSQGHASAASGSASTAATHATNAGNSASAASNSATTASTQASNAVVSASQAATSATNAAGSAATAAASEQVAVDTRNLTLQEGLDPHLTDAEAWTSAATTTGEVASKTALVVDGTVVISGYDVLATRRMFPVDTTRTYRVSVRMRQTTDATDPTKSRVYVGVLPFDENFTYIKPVPAGGWIYCTRQGQTLTVADGWQEFTGTITGIASSGNSAFRPGTKYARIALFPNFSGGDGVTEIEWLRIEDVTSELASEGYASAAATSAAVAQASESEAATSAGAAQTARTAAESARDQVNSSASAAATSASTAGTHATNAGNSASAANTSKVAAESAKADAEAAEASAASSASAASTSASQASTSASNAASSATSASNSANTATTQASNASTSASQAATSATNAAGSEASALSSASVAADTRDQIVQEAGDSQMNDAVAWSLNTRGANPGFGITVANGKMTLGTAFTHSAASFPVTDGRTYRLSVRIRQTVDSTTGTVQNGRGVYCGVVCRNADDTTSIGGNGGRVYFVRSGHQITVADGWQEFSAEISTASGLNAGTERIRLLVGANYAGGDGTAEVDHLIWEDVTSEVAGEAHAAAAASSESAAAASETAAGQSASAAQTSATNAATSAGQASTSATSASNSASTATTQANNASTSASTAAGHATDAGNSASAANTSATNASTSASAASISASSASSSANSASTSAGQASTSASQAASSASTATTKANEASASATIAATTADENQSVNALSRWRTKESWSQSLPGEYPVATASSVITEVADGIQASGGQLWLYLREAIPVDTSRTYELSSILRQTVASSSGNSGFNQVVYPAVWCLDGDKENTLSTPNRYLSGHTGQMALNSDYQEVGTITGEGGGNTNFATGTKFIRVGFLFNYIGGNGTQVLKNLSFADVTEREESEDFASAAATSASLAQTYSDSAGNSATSATNSANTASSQAAAASGSASAADADRAIAANSASAASTSASSASTSASNAASSASAAQSSAVAAQSSAGDASTQAQVATTKAAEASASASSASASQTVALNTFDAVVVNAGDPYCNEPTAWSSALTGKPSAHTFTVSNGRLILNTTWAHSRAFYPISTDRKYRLSVRIRQTVESTSGSIGLGRGVYCGVVTRDANDNAIGLNTGRNYFVASNYQLTVAQDWVDLSADIDGSAFTAGTVGVRLLIGANYSNGNGTAEVDHLIWEDITVAEDLVSAAVAVESSVRASEVGDIEAKYAVKVGVGDYVSGFGLISTANNATPTSEFAVLADRFTIARPDGTGAPKQAFALGEVNGSTTVVLDGDMLADGSIYANNIHATAINKVSNPARWTVGGSPSGWSAGVVSSESNAFGNVRALQLTTNSGFTSFTDRFEVDPTKTYRVDFAVYNGSTAGRCLVGFNTFDKNNAETTVEALGQGATSFGSPATNPYFWVGVVGQAQAPMRYFTSYLLGSNIEAKEAPEGKAGMNSVARFRMNTETKTAHLRFLNIDNGGTTTTGYITHVTVTEVDAGLISGNRIVANSIGTEQLEANSVTAAEINVVDLSAITANLGSIQVGSANLAGTIQSNNYSTTQGWQINKAGSATFNDITIRRNQVHATGNFWIGNFNTSFTNEMTKQHTWWVDTGVPASAWKADQDSWVAQAGRYTSGGMTSTGTPDNTYQWRWEATPATNTVWTGGAHNVWLRIDLWTRKITQGTNWNVEWVLKKVT